MLLLSKRKYTGIKPLMFFLYLCAGLQTAKSQDVLNKTISLNISDDKLVIVLNKISKAGNFYFSYSGNVLPKDSIVSVKATNESVGQILRQLLNEKYEWEARDNYVIITPALRRLSLVNTDLTAEGSIYSVSGIITDVASGERLMNTSVYEKHRLVATLSDEHGYFRLKFRADDSVQIALTASKVGFKDTTLYLLHQVRIGYHSDRDAYRHPDNNSNQVATTGLGRLLISASQRIQSMNIPDFFASRPFQISLTPGLSSHGMLSSQVVNHFSLNLIGGYTAGVNGVEFGGLFNINKQDSRYLQVAGIFNMVGGTMRGLQIAGVHNMAIDTAKGVQFAGFINQSGGLVSGLQLSSLHNEAHYLKGLQIGLVNQADTSEGASIGIVNLIGNGFYRVSLTANNLMNTNIALKTGTHAFYTALLAGTNISAEKKMYTIGLGAGHDLMFGSKFYTSAEVNYQLANTGLWDDHWAQAKVLFNLQLARNISIIAGPTYNHYHHSGNAHIEGYENVTAIPDYPGQAARQYQTKNWLGWEAGLSFNSVFGKVSHHVANESSNWYLGLAGTAGAGASKPYSIAYGGEIFTQRQLGSNLSAVFSIGYTTFIGNKNSPFYLVDEPDHSTIEIFAMPYKIIPIKFGVRSMVTKRFYIGGDLGEAWAKKDDGFYRIDHGINTSLSGPARTIKSFVLSATTGFDFGNGLDAGFKYENYTGFDQVRQFAIRLGYKIKIGK